jgi:hypothetical protein
MSSKQKTIDKCIICDENLNRSIRKPISCLYCAFTACRTCCQTFLLDQSYAKCMNISCGKEWTRHFLSLHFSKTFLNTTFKEVRQKLLYEKEIALLPATQSIIRERIEREGIIDQIIQLNDEIRKLEEAKHLCYQNLRTVHTREDKRQFIRACPVEECRGFLSTQWKCGLCHLFTCSGCHIVKSDIEHICKKDDLATAKLLDSDTKSCPKCAFGIYKIEGCDQMWCTQCHTAFSWRTGRIETTIHNPHYYEWQRRFGNLERNIDDILCGQELSHDTSRTIYNLLNNLYPEYASNFLRKVDDFFRDDFEESHLYRFHMKIDLVIRSTLHLRHIQMPRYRVDMVENNLELRVMYMRNQLDKTQFQIRLQRDNKKHEKHREIYQVLQLFVQTVTDIIFRIIDVLQKEKTFIKAVDILLEIDELVKYVNDCLLDIARTYGSKVKQIRIQEGTLIGNRVEIFV